MKTAGFPSALRLRFLAGLALAVWLGGCATQSVDWAGRVGYYTYEQAVSDLGKPEDEEKLADGARTAEWLTGRGYTYTEPDPGPNGPFYPTYPQTYTAPDQYLRLTFGSDGKLTAWRRVYR